MSLGQPNDFGTLEVGARFYLDARRHVWVKTGESTAELVGVERPVALELEDSRMTFGQPNESRIRPDSRMSLGQPNDFRISRERRRAAARIRGRR